MPWRKYLNLTGTAGQIAWGYSEFDAIEMGPTITLDNLLQKAKETILV